MKTFIKTHYQRAKSFYEKYERLMMPSTLVVGFLVDYVTFTNIQISITFALLLVYWLVAGLLILFIHLYDAQKLPTLWGLTYVRLFSPLAVQFAFGALLGSSLIFYWFFGAFSVSWPLMVIIVLLMIFNDAFRQYFTKPLVQISVYFFCTISLFSLALPFLFNSLSAWLFVAATIASMALFLVDIHVASFWVSHIRQQKRQLFISIIIITGVMNVLYFTNIIPPIPLALREAGLYHHIQPMGGKYIMQGEPEDFFKTLQTAIFGQAVHVRVGEKIYLYTAIFAPANLQTTIVHHWQYYDEDQKDWVDKGKLPFTINGGRQEGYKGYSYNSNLTPGKWRVSVENLRGQVLGRVRFTVEKVNVLVDLQEVVR